MRYTRLAGTGAAVSALGLGCMGMSMWLGERDDKESARVILDALDCGVTLFDTADVYGPRHSEELLGKTLVGRRGEAFILTKFGVLFDENANSVGLDGSPAHMREAIEGSLRRLRTDYVDLYFLHRVDPEVPVEETVGAMAELVDEGKVRFIGLSEPGLRSLRRAQAVHPLAAVENEYSLWTRGVEHEMLPALRELGIALVAYSPLGRGFLTGQIRSVDDLTAADVRRRRFPRFSEDNIRRNRAWLVDLTELAKRKGCSLAQLALAWCLSKGDDVIPIPGTKKVKYLRENVGAVDVRLDDNEVDLLESIVRSEVVAGAQKSESSMKQMGN